MRRFGLDYFRHSPEQSAADASQGSIDRENDEIAFRTDMLEALNNGSAAINKVQGKYRKMHGDSYLSLDPDQLWKGAFEFRDKLVFDQVILLRNLKGQRASGMGGLFIDKRIGKLEGALEKARVVLLGKVQHLLETFPKSGEIRHSVPGESSELTVNDEKTRVLNKRIQEIQELINLK